MAFVQADLDRINKAIASGTRMVRVGDETVEYRTMDELFTARARIEDALASTPADRSSVTTHSKD